MDDLVSAALWAALGLAAGWWFLPQPQWAQDLGAKLKSWLHLS
jgi:membrane protein DedA with SNARE-associated domain